MGILIKGMDEIPEDGCDCISRQAAIDALDRMLQEVKNANLREALKMWIRNAPAVNQWIPCSERLPEKPAEDGMTVDEYIVTIEGALESTVLYWTGSEWCDPVTDDTYRVTAWMELPRPYKEG